MAKGKVLQVRLSDAEMALVEKWARAVMLVWSPLVEEPLGGVFLTGELPTDSGRKNVSGGSAGPDR